MSEETQPEINPPRDRKPTPPSTRIVAVLLIEDNPTDAFLTELAFRGLPFQFTVASDGEAGLQLALDSSPDLILLDLNLPRMRGDEVLIALKTNHKTLHIPVVMLTNSDNSSHIRRAYSLQCSSYLTKPPTPQKFKALAQAMKAWWVDHLKLAPKA